MQRIIQIALVGLLIVGIAAPVAAHSNDTLKRQLDKTRYELATIKQEMGELGYEKHRDGHWHPAEHLAMLCENCDEYFPKAAFGDDDYEYCPHCGSDEVKDSYE